MQNRLFSEWPSAGIQSPAATDWLWRPWYAKLWWVTIPIYWAGAAASLKIPVLAEFYSSVPAAYLNILFFPPTVLLVLGFGFARAWIDARPVDDGSMTLDDIMELDRIKFEQEGWPDSGIGDIYDPFSGTIYVGNPLSPNNGSRV